MKRKDARSGVTLIEAVIASAILAAMVAGAYSVYFSGMSASEDGTIRGGLDRRARATMDRIRQEIRFARITAVMNEVAAPVYQDHTGIRFQVAMGVVAGVGTFGYRVGTGNPTPVANRSAVLRFTCTEQIRETNGTFVAAQLPAIPAGFTQTTVNWDVNLDGDLNDVWVLGRLEIVFLDTAGIQTGAAIGFADQICLRPQAAIPADLDGDVDGDGQADPLFRVLDGAGTEVPNASISASGRKVRVTVCMAHLDHRGRKMLFRSAIEEIRLENPQ